MPAFPAHVLAPAHEKTIDELREKTVAEIRAMRNGRDLERTAERLLNRENVWVKWKLGACQPFDRASLPVDEASKRASDRARTLSRRPKAYPNKLGNANLSRLWDQARSLTDSAAAENRAGETYIPFAALPHALMLMPIQIR